MDNGACLKKLCLDYDEYCCGLSLRGCFVQTCPFVILILILMTNTVILFTLKILYKTPNIYFYLSKNFIQYFYLFSKKLPNICTFAISTHVEYCIHRRRNRVGRVGQVLHGFGGV